MESKWGRAAASLANESGTDDSDARHLFQAIGNGVDYFVTRDARTIVSRTAEIEHRFAIRVRLPSGLVADLGL